MIYIILFILIGGGALIYALKPVKTKVTPSGQLIETKIWHFNENSWHARYYKWLMSTNSLTCGGCKYFWTLVGMTLALIIFSPVVILFHIIGFIIMFWPKGPEKIHPPEYYQKKFDKEQRREKRMAKVGKVMAVVGKVFLILIGLLLLGVFIYEVSTDSKLWWVTLIFLGCVVLLIGLVALVVFLWNNYGVGDKIIHSKPIRYAASLIKKACPVITWNKTDVYESSKNQKA